MVTLINFLFYNIYIYDFPLSLLQRYTINLYHTKLFISYAVSYIDTWINWHLLYMWKHFTTKSVIFYLFPLQNHEIFTTEMYYIFSILILSVNIHYKSLFFKQFERSKRIENFFSFENHLKNIYKSNLILIHVKLIEI